MLKLIGFLLGLATGAGGVAGWLLSEPSAGSDMPVAPKDRVQAIRARFDSALAEGRLSGERTEARLRQELDAYRRDPKRPNPFA